MARAARNYNISAIKEVHRLKKLGNSYRQIARLLNVGRYPHPSGEKWNRNRVHWIFQGPNTKQTCNRKPKTIPAKRLTEREKKLGAELIDFMDYKAPRTRGECKNFRRPCPFVSCKYHLYLDVDPLNGSIKLNFPNLEPWELIHSCALDVADRREHCLEEVGDIINLTRERIRQIQDVALDRVREMLSCLDFDL